MFLNFFSHFFTLQKAFALQQIVNTKVWILPYSNANARMVRMVHTMVPTLQTYTTMSNVHLVIMHLPSGTKSQIKFILDRWKVIQDKCFMGNENLNVGACDRSQSLKNAVSWDYLLFLCSQYEFLIMPMNIKMLYSPQLRPTIN